MAVVEDLDVFEERGSGLTACGEPGSVHELGFERAEEALHGGIIETISLSAHRGLDAMEPEQFAIVAAGVLHAAIRVVDQPLWWSPVPDCHVQRILPACSRSAAKVGPVMPDLRSFAPADRDIAKGALQTLGHRPADDLHCGEILDSSEVEPAFVGRDIRDVGQPDRIGDGDIELALKEIGCDGMAVAAVGSDRHAPPASRWTEPFLLHEPGNGAFRDTKAAIPKLGMDPRSTIAFLALQEDYFDLGPKTVTTSSTFSPSWHRALPGIIAATGDAQGTTHKPDGML